MNHGVPIDVVIFTRPGCHLCDKAESLLRSLDREFSIRLQLVNIDENPELVSRYGEKVPVVQIDGKESQFGCINPVLLRRALRGAMLERKRE
jgi:glutaredoxin